jgi:hypothetical protein
VKVLARCGDSIMRSFVGGVTSEVIACLHVSTVWVLLICISNVDMYIFSVGAVVWWSV